MIFEYIGVKEINGSLIVLDDVDCPSYEEIVEIRLDNGTVRHGRIVAIEGSRAVIQVFEGTRGISLQNTHTRLKGRPMELDLSPEIQGRIFSGVGAPIDGLGRIYPEKRMNVNGTPINPVSRVYPQNYICTGISSIDTLITLIRGQKLPIFSGSGMKHNELAAQIVRQAKIANDEDAKFCIVFAAMGVKNDVADYFRRSFEESGVLQRVTMFLNLANDPIIERILTPRCALTAAEYLAFEHDMHVLVIMTDMTSYAEACREPFLKINLYHADPEERIRTRAQLESPDLDLVYSEVSSVECSASGVSKGSGLERLCGLLGIPMQACIAVGDAEHDVAMLRAAGLGVAMGNAPEHVKTAADRVVSDLDHGGCAEAIRLLLD